jgi:hypothetical protein
VSFQELDSALAVMDEWQHTVLFGRRVEISFNRFSTVGRQWSNKDSAMDGGDGESSSDHHHQRS